MIYNWGKKELIEERNKLEQLIRETADPVYKEYLLFVSGVTTSTIDEIYGDTPPYNISTKSYIHNMAESITYASRYYSVVSDYYFSLDKLLEKVDWLNSLLDERMEDSDDLKALGCTKTTPVKALTHTREFYKLFDDELFEIFKKAESNSYISFPKENSELLPTLSDGRTYFIDGVKTNMILVKNSRDARMYSNLVHEFGHAIKNLITPTAAYSNEFDYFSEVPSIFPELVSLEENVSNYPDLVMKYLKYDSLVEYYNVAYLLSSHKYIDYQLKKAKYMINPSFFATLREEEAIDRKDFYKSIKTDIAQDGTYVLSYIVSLELLNLYRRDKKEALKRFKEILRIMPSPSYLGEVMNIVPLNVNAKEESERVFDELILSLKK